jgi:SAM-dependent methyltransferase
MSGQSENAQLEQLRKVWAVLGEEDPLWAVLSRADKRGGRWDVEEFLATGHSEIEGQLALLAGWKLPFQRRRALDFGCGAGRLTRALAAHFGEAIGVDVSPSMIAKARSLNADLGNLRFIENRTARLEGIADASIDLVYSCMTLQHIPAELALAYVAEFLRVLAPGGVAAFQFVAGTDRSWRGRLFELFPNRWLNPLRRLAWRRQAVFEMHVLEEPRLRELLARDSGLRLLAAIDDGAAGTGWASRRWYLTREDAAQASAA